MSFFKNMTKVILSKHSVPHRHYYTVKKGFF